jgi:hypothetical protein
MDWKTTISLLVTVFLAFTGYIITYLNSRKLSQRKELLEHTERQLKQLYGPLYALVNSASTVLIGFLNNNDLVKRRFGVQKISLLRNRQQHGGYG